MARKLIKYTVIFIMCALFIMIGIYLVYNSKTIIEIDTIPVVKDPFHDYELIRVDSQEEKEEYIRNWKKESIGATVN